MTTTTKLTLEEFLKLPETKLGSEYVDGKVVQKVMPTAEHGLIIYLLITALGPYLSGHPIGIAGPEILCVFGPTGKDFGRLPDLMFVRRERLRGLRRGQPFYGAPDLAVEVVSPDDRMSDVMEKVTLYLTNGVSGQSPDRKGLGNRTGSPILRSVRLVWIIDPATRQVMVMRTPTAMTILNEGDTLDGEDVLPGFQVPVHEILPSLELFADDDEPSP